MKQNLLYLKDKGVQIPIICGGAALKNEYVSGELQPSYGGVVAYGKDAFSGLKFMQSLD